MKRNKVKAILMDCDGVLLDSELIYLTSVSHFLMKIGVNTSVQELAYLVGSDAESIMEKIKEDFSLYEYTTQELMREQKKQFDEEFSIKKVKENVGLSEFLKKMRKSGMRLAVVSSSSKPYVAEVIKQLKIKDYFETIIGKEDVKKSKPYPDLYLHALKIMGIHPKETLILEDSKNGIHAGKLSGCEVIAYCGSSIRQDTREADYRVNSYEELEALILSMQNNT